MTEIRQIWSRSKSFRIVLLVVAIYTLLRLVGNGMFLAEIVMSGQTEGHDLQVYLDAATRLQQRQALYPTEELVEIEFYQYSPAYALAFVPFLRSSFATTAVVLTLLHIVAYGLLYICWRRVFRRMGLEQASQTLAWLLPVWLIFSAFWSDLGYLNVYIFVALFATLLIDAVLRERLGWAVLWLSIILQVKPQWAFAVVVPMLLGRWRFFVKLLGLTVVAYAAIVVVTMLTVGPSYGWQQYGEYFRVLSSLLGQNYLWRTVADGFLGYNHSITQIVVYLTGVSPGAFRLAMGIKVLVLLPLLVAAVRHLRRPVNRAGQDVPLLGLDLAFAFYLAAFIWLEVVWEVTLGVAVFTYLLAVSDRRSAKRVAWVVFLPYALVDFWRLFSFVVFGPDVMLPGPYVLTDPSIYIPLVMIVILTFYLLLIRRLWVATGR